MNDCRFATYAPPIHAGTHVLAYILCDGGVQRGHTLTHIFTCVCVCVHVYVGWSVAASVHMSVSRQMHPYA